VDGKEYSNDSDLSLDEIIEKYYTTIWRNTLFLVRFSEDDAYDITQNVFLLLAQKWDELDKSNIGAWLFEVSRRKIFDFFRTEEKQRGGKHVISIESSNCILSDFAFYDNYFEVNPDLLERIKNEVLDSLSSEERSLYNDLFVNGRSYKDIVELYSISYTDATTKGQRLRDRIKKLIVIKVNSLNLFGITYLSFTIYLLSVLLNEKNS